MKKIRCAIYTRKSAEEGLAQEFNSLDAQREACAAYVASQKAEGWVLLPTVYEDAGLSGGTLERPGLQRLLADIDAGLVDQIVVYKVDRLTRSLSDFAKLVERLEAAGAGFVSVRRCCTARSKSLTSLCRLQSHPAQYVSGIPSAAILLSISHPIRCSTRCFANVRARISGPMIAL